MCTYLFIMACCVSGIYGFGFTKLLGKGQWSVLNFQQCKNAEEFPIQLEVVRTRINRTHDGFNGWLKLDQTIDDSYGVVLDSCKYVDGGCKPFQTLTDESFCKFVKKHAYNNFAELLSLFDMEPDCPLPQGSYEVEGYTFDYNDLPSESIYGKFETDVNLMKDDVTVACLTVTTIFAENETDED